MKTPRTLGMFGHDHGANQVLDALTATEGQRRIQVARYRKQGLFSHEEIATLAKCSALVFGISAGDSQGVEASLAAKVLERNPCLSGKIFFLEAFPGRSGAKSANMMAVGQHTYFCSITHVPKDSLERQVFKSVHMVGNPDRVTLFDQTCGANVLKLIEELCAE